MAGTLYIVATPIGNLGDISFRAIEVLKSVNHVLCEDTRVTRVLLDHYGITTPTISYHQHSEEKKVRKIRELLEEGKNLALVTDAGTPGISDPGNKLVEFLVLNSEFGVIPIPGVSAVVTALSISGFPTDKFIFLGFPPHKKGRKSFFERVGKAEYTVAFYESSHRIKKCLNELANVLVPDRKLCVCRELTKKFESIYEFFGSHFDRVYGGEGFSDVNRSRANWGVIDRVRRMRGEVGFHMNMIRQGIENRTLNEKAYKSFLETPTKEFVDICLEKWPEDKTWFYTTIYYRSQEDSLREQGLRMVRTKAHT